MGTDLILKNATDERLALAVQENLFVLFRLMSTLPGSQLDETERLSRHLTFPHNPMYKGVWNAHLMPDDADNSIEESIQWFKSREAPFFFWWTGPGTHPDDIGSYLTRHGLLDMESQSREMAPGIKSTTIGAPGMIADLYHMNESVLEKVPQGFEIHDLQSAVDLQDFKRVIVEGYGMPASMAEGWVQSTQEFGIGKTPWRMLLGRLDGEPVATNMVLRGAGVIGVYGVAVHPSARGKGIGAAITLKPLLDARDQDGYNYAVLFSTEMGAPVYKRMGFRMTDTRINRYLWRNS